MQMCSNPSIINSMQHLQSPAMNPIPPCTYVKVLYGQAIARLPHRPKDIGDGPHESRCFIGHAALSFAILASRQPCVAKPSPSTSLAVTLLDRNRSPSAATASNTKLRLPNILPSPICTTLPISLASTASQPGTGPAEGPSLVSYIFCHRRGGVGAIM